MQPEDNQFPLLSDQDSDNDVAYGSGEKVHVIGINDPDDEGSLDVVPPFSWKKLCLFTSSGFLISIAFLDSGNLEDDLQAGAIAGYSLLWLLMWAMAMGLLVMAELALIGADIQEVIGSAIAIKILSNGALPLWAGVLITTCDWPVFIFLFLENYGVRKLEAFFAVLIATMEIPFAWMFGETKPSGTELLGILVPKLSFKIIKQAVGKAMVQEALIYYSIESATALIVSFIINLLVTTVFAKAFYNTEIASSIGLVNAGQYLEAKYGGGLIPILYIWAIGLLAAGQSSTITGTYAGQFIMGGFLKLRLKKWLRALITRSCAIIPTIIVALIFNTSERNLDVLNEWLNVLQSIQIPFALIPLLCLVSKEQIMCAFKIGNVLKVGRTPSYLICVVPETCRVRESVTVKEGLAPLNRPFVFVVTLSQSIEHDILLLEVEIVGESKSDYLLPILVDLGLLLDLKTWITILALIYDVNDVPLKLSVIELEGLWQIALLDLSYAAERTRTQKSLIALLDLSYAANDANIIRREIEIDSETRKLFVDSQSPLRFSRPFAVKLSLCCLESNILRCEVEIDSE
ncbi:Metal transporter Nramp2 [Hibiscus syriacus]|uniref:Metal transporter Nramp2 n=1 Tax=Hibiscus syriacus TaxID=106335 RepID=A0A6A3AJU8_HIBSY|nr:Metal transporter Nramp2 [Hibiscus syriacus]